MYYELLTQLVEHLPCKQYFMGLNPTLAAVRNLFCNYSDLNMAKMAFFLHPTYILYVHVHNYIMSY